MQTHIVPVGFDYELAEELREQRDLLRDLLDEGVDDDRVRDRLETATELLAEFDERGTAIGAKEELGE